MIDMFKTYETYKDSGVPWLGNLPSHWDVVRNKSIFVERSQRSLTGEETLLTVSHITGVTPRSEKNVNMFMAESMAGYKVCQQGDLLINTMWAWMGALGTSRHKGICSPAYGVYAPRNGVPYDSRYFDYLYRTPHSIAEMTRNSKGIVSSRLRLYTKEFYRIVTILPPLEEQRAIADYLDGQTAVIDQKITLLTQKAAHYSQLKQSLINETVTRGLDKTVPLKESGVDWLGQIPAHWQVQRIKDVAFLKSGNAIVTQQIETEGSYPVYGGNGIRGFYKAFTHEGNYILIGRQGALCGNINYASGKFWASEHAVVVHLKRNVEVMWFGELLRVMNLNQYSLSAAQPGLSVDRIKRLLIPLPPQSEQASISEYLNTKIDSINQIIESIDKQIEKLKELRKSLINDVVTGKIKVVDLDDSHLAGDGHPAGDGHLATNEGD